MKNFAMAYYGICIWLARLAYLNLLWIAFSLLGLVLFGVMPATIAMFAVARKWVAGEANVSIFKTFWQTFKSDFIKANLLGIVLLIIGSILYIDLVFVRNQSGLLFTFLHYGLLMLFFIYFLIILYIFPLFVHFKLKMRQYIKWAIVISITHPVITAGILVGALASFYVTFYALPGLMLFFGGSTIAFILTWGAFRTFSRFEQPKVIS